MAPRRGKLPLERFALIAGDSAELPLGLYVSGLRVFSGSGLSKGTYVVPF